MHKANICEENNTSNRINWSSISDSRSKG